MNSSGSMSLLLLLRYSDFMGNNHISITIPCIKNKRITVKTYLKDQQALTFILLFRMFSMRALSKFSAFFLIFLTSCANITPIKSPEVSLINIEPAKTKGFAQYFTLNLLVTNPNSFDLDIEGVTFNLDVVNQKVMSGVSHSVPVLKAYSETPVSISASIGLFDLLKLLTYFAENPAPEMKYKLTTTIDPNGFIPLTINRDGVFNDELLSGLKKSKKKV
jgi:LEA14-like dessication related protein